MANKLTAAQRTEFGKGAARRTRRAGLIPAVLYGHGTEPQHISLPAHDTFMIVRSTRNALIELDMDGKEQLALVKAVQVDPVLRAIEHVDLVIIRRGEKVVVQIPVITAGESFSGTIHQIELMELTVEAPAIAIPENITVDIEGLTDGTIIRVADLKLPQDVTTAMDPEAPVVIISVLRTEEEPVEAAVAEGGEPAAAAAPAEAADSE